MLFSGLVGMFWWRYRVHGVMGFNGLSGESSVLRSDHPGTPKALSLLCKAFV